MQGAPPGCDRRMQRAPSIHMQWLNAAQGPGPSANHMASRAGGAHDPVIESRLSHTRLGITAASRETRKHHHPHDESKTDETTAAPAKELTKTLAKDSPSFRQEPIHLGSDHGYLRRSQDRHMVTGHST